MNAEYAFIDLELHINNPNKIRKFIGNRNITTNIYIIQAHDSIICGYFCFVFIDLMLKGKNLLDCTNLFPTKKI